MMDPLKLQVEQDDFEKIKLIVARDTLLTYLNFHEIFKIHTNASEFQLGAVISQKGKPITFYIRKLTGAHKRYTFIDEEILITV